MPIRRKNVRMNEKLNLFNGYMKRPISVKRKLIRRNRTANVGFVEKEMKRLITFLAIAANWLKRSTKLCMNGFPNVGQKTSPIHEKNTMLSTWLCHSSEIPSENKRKRKDRQVLEPCQRTKKEHEREGNTNCSWWTWKGSQRLWDDTGSIGTQ